MRWLRKAEWPNYYLSTSTTFSRAAGMIVGLVAPAPVAASAYYRMIIVPLVAVFGAALVWLDRRAL
jgi:hypothetical protein